MGSTSGPSHTSNLLLPTYLETPDVVFTHVSVGKNHMAAVTSLGKLITWGNPESGKLGHT